MAKAKFIPCKHLDYSDIYEKSAKIVEHPTIPNFKWWERRLEGDNVQFCQKNRSRINNEIDCYGWKWCHEPE